MSDLTAHWLCGDALHLRPDGLQVLLGSRCDACEQVCFPVAPVCPACAGENLRTVELSRSGQLYAWSRVHVGPRTLDRPFTLGFVDLPEGVRVLARIQGEELQPGQAVTLGTDRIGTAADGTPLHNFVFRG